MSEPLEIGFHFTHALERYRVAGPHVDKDDIFCVVPHRIPEPAVVVFHPSLLNVWEGLAGVGFQPFFSFAIMLATWFSPKALSASSGLPSLAQVAWSLSCPVGAAVLEHELVD
ncbi:MAG: hypothetical protein AB2556_24190 [Candidatus Thiodiazotropha sp.]